MKRSLPFLFLLFIFFSCSKHNDSSGGSAAPIKWNQLAQFPGTVNFDPIAFSIGNRIYAGMAGSVAFGPSKRATEFFAYDKVANAWMQLTSFPVAALAYPGAGFVVAGEGYVVLSPDSSDNGLYAYDTAHNSWSRKTNYPGVVQGSPTAFAINGFGYVGLGESFTPEENGFYQYDPVADSWTKKSNYPGTHPEAAASFVIGNLAYVGTGAMGATGSSDGNNVSTEFYSYDPASDTWTPKANFVGVPRYGAAGFAVGNDGYMVGGSGANNEYVADLWQYDPSADKWAEQQVFTPGGRYAGLAFSGDSVGYFGFGANNVQPMNDLWKYRP